MKYTFKFIDPAKIIEIEDEKGNEFELKANREQILDDCVDDFNRRSFTVGVKIRPLSPEQNETFKQVPADQYQFTQRELKRYSLTNRDRWIAV